MYSHSFHKLGYALYRAFNIIMVLTMVLGSPSSALAATWTDPTDYPPGSSVAIQGDNSNGAAYLEGEIIDVSVSGPNDENGNPYTASCEATVTAPDPVNKPGYLYWTCSVTLWNNAYAVGVYNYTAFGRTSGVSEAGGFTDAVTIRNDFSQAANGNAFTGISTWINGILNESKTVYKEGMSSPQRLVIWDGPAASAPDADGYRYFVFSLAFVQGTHYAYDFPTGSSDLYPSIWGQAKADADFKGLPWDDLAPLGQLKPGTDAYNAASYLLTSGTRTQMAFPDTFTGAPAQFDSIVAAYEGKYGDRLFDIYHDGHMSDFAFDTANFVAQQGLVYYTFKYKVPSGGTPPNRILFAWGGHIAVGYDGKEIADDWGLGMGAGAISGGPYHVRTEAWNPGGNIGSQDNQIMAAAVIAPGLKSGYKFEDLNGNKAKDANEPFLADWTINATGTDYAGKQISLTTTTNANGYYEFVLDPGTYKVFEDLKANYNQTRPYTGMSLPTGYTLVNAGNGTLAYQFTMGEAQNHANNDFGNRLNTGSLVIKKVFDPLTSGFTGTFDINYDCDDGTAHDGTVQLAAGKSATISGIPIGTSCTVSEPSLPTAPVGWTFGEVSISPVQPVTINSATTPVQVDVTNSISRDNGNLKLSKSLTGEPVGYTGPFKISYDCDGTAYDGFVSINAGSYATVYDIPTGTKCTISETLPTPPAGYAFATPTYNPSDEVTISEKGATVEVTTNNKMGQDLVVTKTAKPTFTRTWDWTIAKDYDGTYNLFAGASVTHDYKVTVTPVSTDSAWKVVGTITINNPISWEDVVAKVSDSVDNGGKCTLDDPNQATVTVPKGGSVDVNYTCTWETKPTDYAGINTATVTWDKATYSTPTGSASGPKAFEFKDPTEINPTITVDDDNLTGESWSADRKYAEWTYQKEFACSSDPTKYAGDGVDSYSLKNTAKINETTGDSDSATVTVNCYAPVISKTAAGTYDERHEWTVEKTVDPTSQSGFAGDTLPFNWTIIVTESVFEENFDAAGEITVVNPAPMDMTVALADVLSDSTVAVIGTCTNGATFAGGSLTIPASTTTVCGYTANNLAYTDNAKAPTGNTATATLNDIPFEAPAEIKWTANVIRPEVELTDLQGPLSETITGTSTWTYEDNYTCSTDKTKYTENYSYTETIWNTAKVTSGTYEKSSTTSTEVTCFVPEISKTAAGTYGERHEWSIEKKVNPLTQDAFAGQTVNYTWTVDVTEEVFEESFYASGKITLVNHNAEDAMTVSLSDMLSDGTQATITSCTGDADLSDGLTVAAGGTSTCDYSATLDYKQVSDAPTTNTATAVLNGISFNTEPTKIPWTPTVTRGGATLDDDQNPAFPLEITEGGTWTYNDSYTCSTNPGDYKDGSYTYDESNKATVTSGDKSADAEAKTSVICHAPVVTKDATTYFNRDWDWTITKVENATYNLFAGGSVTHGYTVTVDPTYTDNFWGVKGDITITNSHPTADMVLTSINDLAGGIDAKVTCDSLTVPAGGSLTCTYDTGKQDKPNANPFGNLNTATAVFAGVNWTGTAQIAFNTTPTTEDQPVITVDDDNLENEAWSANRTKGEWTYNKDFACSTDVSKYTDGKYSYSLTNTAKINETGQTDTAKVDVNCYAPVVTKDVTTYFNRDWDWTITKDYDATYNLFAGDIKSHGYKVTVDPTYTDNFWGAKGNITITNSHPTDAMTLTSVSDLAGGIDAKVTCASLVVPAKSSLTCTYDTGKQDNPNANPFGNLNTATAVFAGVNWTGTAQIAFSTTPTTEDQPVITIDDNNLTDEAWSADRSYAEWIYNKDFACSTDASKYTDGKYSYSLTNTAKINETGQTDTAKVDVYCYAPVVTKDATTYFNRDWDWTITKDYDGSYNLFAGDKVPHGYKVAVTPTFTDNFWGVKGSITVKNGNPDAAMTLTSLTDLAGGINGVVTCASLVVPAKGSLTCTYDTGKQDNPNANPFGNLNTVTAVFAGANWTGTAPIAFNATPTTEDEPVITIDDDNLTDENWSANRAKAEWTYKKDFACSTDASKYTDGKYSFSHINTATINETDQTDTAKVDINCYWPMVELTKTGDTLSKIGDGVTYTIKLENKTPIDAGLRNLSCKISDATIGFSKDVTLASGASDSSTKSFTIPATASDPFVNTASVECKPVAATAPVVADTTFKVSDTSEWSTNLFQPAVEIIKSGPDFANSFDVITYTFTIKNTSSSDSPNLILDTLTDDKLGNLADAAPADCDELAPGASCTFDVKFTVPDVGLSTAKITNIVTVHYHPAGFPNDIKDADTHTVTITPPSLVTNSMLCTFDVDSAMLGNQFRLLFTPDGSPNKLNASNPGQYYYNIFYTNPSDVPVTPTVKITLPYPFVTQGAVPIHAYSSVVIKELNGQRCLYPGSEIFNTKQFIVTLGEYAPQSMGQTRTLEVELPEIPAGGFVYTNIHLDYGLKGTSGWSKGGVSGNDALNSGIYPDILNNQPYKFTDDFSPTKGVNQHQVYSINNFKKNPGIGGLAQNTLTDGVSKATVKIYNATKSLLGTVYTDVDGWYMWPYKWTGKAAIFYVKLMPPLPYPQAAVTQTVTLKANGYLTINFLGIK